MFFCFLDHLLSAGIFGASVAGRFYSKQMGVTRWPWTVSMLMIPAYYILAVHQKEKRFPYINSERRSFEQDLEFYPVTRRAWNRAI